jgi:hypothetical protein
MAKHACLKQPAAIPTGPQAGDINHVGQRPLTGHSTWQQMPEANHDRNLTTDRPDPKLEATASLTQVVSPTENIEKCAKAETLRKLTKIGTFFEKIRL